MLSTLRPVLVRPEFGAVLGATLLWVIFASLGADNGFITVAGTAGILEVAAQVGIVGTAVALLMIAGQFDLSVGSTIGATGMILALALSEFQLPVWAAVVLALALGVLIGAWTLADHHYGSIRVTAAKHRPFGPFELQTAAIEGGDGRFQRFQAVGGGGQHAGLFDRRGDIRPGLRHRRAKRGGGRRLGAYRPRRFGQAIDRLVGI